MVMLHDPISLALDACDDAKQETDLRSVLREFGLDRKALCILHRGNNPHGNNGRRKTREARLQLRSFSQ
jgi:hypothetical protein